MPDGRRRYQATKPTKSRNSNESGNCEIVTLGDEDIPYIKEMREYCNVCVSAIAERKVCCTLRNEGERQKEKLMA